jgi:hypothetical protein
LGVQELPHHRLFGAQQHLAGAEHGEVAVVEQADVVGDRARGVDVVGDDEERRAGVLAEIDDQLVEERRADRVEAGVGLVEQHDLRVEHERSGEPGALAHAAGDLAGELGLRALEADHVDLVHDDAADLALGLLGVLAERERDVVVEVHRAEQRAVLEEDAEQLADLVQLPLAAGGDVGALNENVAFVRFEQADEALEEDGLAGTGRAEHDVDLARGEGQRDVAPDELAAEGLRQPLDADCHPHTDLPCGLGQDSFAGRRTTDAGSNQRSPWCSQRTEAAEVTRQSLTGPEWGP